MEAYKFYKAYKLYQEYIDWCLAARVPSGNILTFRQWLSNASSSVDKSLSESVGVSVPRADTSNEVG